MDTRALGLKVYLISKGQVKPANKQFNPNGQYAPRSHVDMHERTCERASVHAALTSREHAPYSTFRRRTDPDLVVSAAATEAMRSSYSVR